MCLHLSICIAVDSWIHALLLSKSIRHGLTSLTSLVSTILTGGVWLGSIWLAHANTQRGFMAKLADYGTQHPLGTQLPGSFHTGRRPHHPPPELMLEVCLR